jgi:plasmid stabilization system protein ParE
MDEKVVEEVLWTDKAKSTFDTVVNYLSIEWSEKEVRNFIQRTNNLISTIQYYPELFKLSQKRHHIRIGLITKHTQLIYHYKPKKRQIVILYFWGTQQNPRKQKY